MAHYLLIRTLRWTSGLLLVLLIAYAMMYYGAGDPVRRMFLDREEAGAEFDDAQIELLRAQYGLDRPFPQQFVNYLSHITQGDLGMSLREKRPVATMVRIRLPISIQLGVAASLLVMLIGIPLGIFSALHHNRWLDTLIVGTISLLDAIPIFVTGPLLLLFLVLVINLMDVPSGWKGIWHSQVILPIVVITLGSLPLIVRQTRAAMLETLSEDYIRTAHAKGLPSHLIIARHMLRPVLIPVVTSLGLVLIGLVDGAIFVEKIFNIPGFGSLTLQGLQNVDYSVIMAGVLVGTLIVMAGNLFVDLIYPLLDPRMTRRN